jgi:lipopolysaccharide heptosyltransferase I
MGGQNGRSGAAGNRRILIVKTSSIGDVVHALPIASVIDRQDPNVFVGWVVRKRCAELVRGNPHLDRVYVTPDRPTLADLLRLRGELRADSYDTALDPQGLFISGLITWMSGARRRVGLDLNREGNALFLTEPTVPARSNRDRHAIDILRGFLPKIGIDEHCEWPTLDYLASGETLPSPVSQLDRKAGLIALNVGASSAYKQWPVDRWSSLARMLIDAGYTPIVIGGPGDVDAAAAVCGAAGTGENILDLAGRTTLRGLAHVLAHCDLLVSADTGPLHLAVAVGTATIALFGSTNPVRTGPYGSRNRVISKELSCSPCFRAPTCAGRVDCMRAISAGEVASAVTRLVKEFAQC